MADIMPQGGAGDDDDILIDTTEGAADPAVPVLAEDGTEQALPKGAVRQDDGSVLFTLQYPCAIRYRRRSDGATREEQLSELHLRRLTGADMRKISAASPDMMTVVAVACSARMPDAQQHKMKLFFDAMDAADAAAAMEIVSGFLGTGRPTGR
jgi:hypothetical protein